MQEEPSLIKSPVDQELKRIELRESHLWFLTLGLLLVLGGATAATFYIILDGSGANSEIMGSIGLRALGGFSVLIVLFSVYVLRSRVTFRKVKGLLEKQALRDSLTGLYNRHHFDDRLGNEIVRADRNRALLAVLLCDLDNFKIVNDRQGHHTGDEVLIAVARAVQDAVRGSDLVFRWGGDEIVVLIPNTSREGMLIAADRIRKWVGKAAKEKPINLDVSIGIAIYPEHGKTKDELIRMADRALYIAKNGGGKVHIGDEEYGLNENSIEVVFQPIVDTRTQEILGYEALSRDPEGKVPISELFRRYQAVGQLNRLKSLCFNLQLVKAEKLGLKRVFINVDSEVIKNLTGVRKPSGMEVILEVSEYEAARDAENFLAIAREWRTHGFKFAIDDFGAAFIALPFVARLVPDYIKIARSTVLEATSSEEYGKFLKDLLVAFRNYVKEGIIAQGIETEKELKVMNETGSYLVQGFLPGKPQGLE